MKKLLLSILLIFLLSATIVSADRTIDYVVREGMIDENNSFSATTTPVTGFNVVGYACLDSTCGAVSDEIFNVSSGSSDNIRLTYPTTLQSQFGYAVYYYKDGYIPWEQNPNWAGTDQSDPQGPFTKYLSKKTSCAAPIDTFETINDAQPNIPIIIALDASLDAITYAAIQSSGPLDYVPPQLASHYSVDTNVTLVITDASGNVVFTEIKSVTIPYSGSQRVEFTWTPTVAGDYTTRATTDVTDSKCLASQQQYAQKEIHVINDVPQNACYTLLNNLATNDKFPTAGDKITISAEKISNYADGFSFLTAVPTSVSYKVVNRESQSVIASESLTILSNQNNFDPQAFSFNVDIPATSTGFHDISVTAVADSTLCNGLSNLAETASQSFFVNQKPASAPVLSNLSDITIQEGSPALDNAIDLQSFTTDPDTPLTDLRYSIVTQSNPSLISCSIDSNRYIDCTAPVGFGYSQVTVQVSDTMFNDQDSFVVFVNRKPVSPPELANLPDITIQEGSPALDNAIDLQSFTTDPDTPLTDLRYSIVTQSNPSLISCSIDSNRYIDCTAPVGFGYSQVTVQVSDTMFNDQDSFVVSVNPLPINNAPTIISKPRTIAIEDLTYSYDADARDQEDDFLTFSLIQGPTGMTINSQTGLIEWKPDEDDIGDEVPITIQVSDGVVIGLQSYILNVFEFPHRFSLSSISLSGSGAAKAGSSIDVYNRVFNSGHHEEKNLRFQIIIPELGIQSPISRFNLGVQDTKWVGFTLDIPKTADRGEYLVELLLSNDEFTDKKVASITVI